MKQVIYNIRNMLIAPTIYYVFIYYMFYTILYYIKLYSITFQIYINQKWQAKNYRKERKVQLI